MRKIGVIGNSSFRIDANIGTQVVDIMREFGEVAFLTRGSPGLDQFVMAVGPIIGRTVLCFPAKGGLDNIERDGQLIEALDALVAFMDPETMDQKTGTLMVVERAQSAGKPVRVYTEVDGQLVWAAETDVFPA